MPRHSAIGLRACGGWGARIPPAHTKRAKRAAGRGGGWEENGQHRRHQRRWQATCICSRLSDASWGASGHIEGGVAAVSAAASREQEKKDDTQLRCQRASSGWGDGDGRRQEEDRARPDLFQGHVTLGSSARHADLRLVQWRSRGCHPSCPFMCSCSLLL